ncbi:holo-ACP synthase [Clostridium rectalis]|uniref:holo-ACP synthase n=1 Tax=Clostridium rectalis TaxID=2040295 RepID=UPI000F641631|nr:holo-ACP synthase [Clostridium rectalis]
MIAGIGTDIVEIERIRKAIKRNPNFIKKLFTLKEIEYFKSRNFSNEFIAGRFAAKEAVSKALGTGFRGFSIKDIEIDRDELGKPLVNLDENIENRFFSGEYYRIHVSISHSRDNAIAYAILEVDKDENRNLSGV